MLYEVITTVIFNAEVKFVALYGTGQGSFKTGLYELAFPCLRNNFV